MIICRRYPSEKMKSESAVTSFLKGRLKVLQSVLGYRFSVDAVLLADFIDEPNDHRIIDLGTGCGIIPLLMASEKGYKNITGVEIQEGLADYAKTNVIENGFQAEINITQADFRTFRDSPPAKLFDAVITNPPYKKPGTGKINPIPEKAIARHELTCSLHELIEAASAVTKKKGTFYVIYHPFRMDEMTMELKKNDYHIERFRSIHPYPGEPASLFLLKAAKHSTKETVIDSPIIIYEKKDEYTEYMSKILAIEKNRG